ncbi:MAG: hypothetical protein EOP54_12660 [Sphingobacteriales bacterium]|nr:MAG: hypothetical protein EOP54_12660 [Sphingobacteriales bacterium]
MSIIRLTEGESITEIEKGWTVFTDFFQSYAGNYSHFTADRGTNMGNPKQDTDESTKYFKEGWWSADAEGNKRITEAYIGDTVYFHIKTQNIPDTDANTKKASEVTIQLYDDDGGWGNPSDPIGIREVTKDPATGKDIPGNLITSKQVKGNKVSFSLTLSEGLVSFIEEDNGDEIELFFECGYKEEQKITLPFSSFNYLNVFEKEVKVTVIIELPHSGYSMFKKGQFFSAKGLAGHSAMAVGDRYFDYGPDNVPGTYSESKYDVDFNDDGDKVDDVYLDSPSFENAPGRPWWGEMVADELGIKPNEVTLNQVLDFISLDWRLTNIYGEVHKVEFYVKESEAKKMISWWEERYKHLKVYSVYPWTGEQCTTTVKTAIQQAFPLEFLGNSKNYISDDTQKPSGLLAELKKFVGTSKEHYNEPATGIIIKNEAVDFKPK